MNPANGASRQQHATQKKHYAIRTHQPGDMGLITHRHGVVYARDLNWPPPFEAMVGRITASFLDNYDPSAERCWVAERTADGAFLGSIMLVRETGVAGAARLRVLLVEEDARGMGLGGELVRRCLEFAREAGYERVLLMTARVLEGARRLYKKEGFELVSAKDDDSFGEAVVQEHWELTL